MDTRAIFTEALRIWNTAIPADLCAAKRFPYASEEDLVASGSGAERLLLLGNNLSLMAALAERVGSNAMRQVNLVYMDPPYFTNREHLTGAKLKRADGKSPDRNLAFSDKWRSRGGANSFEEAMETYLIMLTARIIAAREMLASDGSLWLHLDRRAVHYARVMADIVFGGSDHLINEIVWMYKSGGASTRRFANKHDTLLFYAKNKREYKFFPQDEKSYNRELKRYYFKGIKEYRDDVGWYTIVNMKDVWEIPMVGRTASERTGYAAQKPEALIERILRACTEEGDLCMDPFVGSGSLGAAAEKLGRGWICMDESPLAVDLTERRLSRLLYSVQ